MRMNGKLKSMLMDGTAMARAIMRISHEIAERNKGVEDSVLIGIVTRGAPLARKIRDNIEKIEGNRVETGYVDITLYRDDLSEISDMPKVKKTDVPFSIKDKKRDPLRRRSLHGAHGARGDGSGACARQTKKYSACRSDRSRTQRAAHSRRLRRQKHSHFFKRSDRREIYGNGRRRMCETV